MTKIILLQGPPGAGKDTIANTIHQLIDKKSETVKFAAPLKTIALHLFCNGDSRLFHSIDGDQKKKNEPSELFFGKSCRQAQIDISEIYLKKAYSERIFGQILAATIEKKSEEGTEVFFVSDSGFKPEALELAERFGPQNVMLIRLHREGHTYDGDSRNYVFFDEDEGIESHDIDNVTGDINRTVGLVAVLVNKFINPESN